MEASSWLAMVRHLPRRRLAEDMTFSDGTLDLLDNLLQQVTISAGQLDPDALETVAAQIATARRELAAAREEI